jgi:hypothetical protein
MSKPGEKMNRIPIVNRERVYTQQVWEEGELVEIEIGKGSEIVREIASTDEGVKLYNDMVAMGTVDDFLRTL